MSRIIVDSIRNSSASSDNINLDSNGNLLIGNTSYNAGGFGGSARGINVAGVQPQILLHETDTDKDAFIGVSGSQFFVHTQDGITIRFGTADVERMTIDTSGDLRVQRVYSNTTSGGANVRVQSDGLMQRDTSSRRYKNTIADATHGLADLNKLRPVTYKGNNDGDTVFGGLIAEEVHDAGLTEFVDYDSDNQPDALKYGNMVSLCIKAIQQLSAKVDTLETKVAALEAG